MGTPQVGVTSFLRDGSITPTRHLNSNDFAIGMAIETLNCTFGNNDLCTCSLWQLRGHNHFNILYRTFFKGAAGCLLFFDLSKSQTFEDLEIWVKLIKALSSDIPITLIGTKSDLEIQVFPEQIDEFLRTYDILEYNATSIRGESKRDIVFHNLVTQIISSRSSNVKKITQLNSNQELLPEIVNQAKAILIRMYPIQLTNNTNLRGRRRNTCNDFNTLKFKINDYLTLKFSRGRTIIYVNNEEFRQCKYLLLNIQNENLIDYEEIDSIDEAAEFLSHSQERAEDSSIIIPPEVEFWGHCSNIQAWTENGYDTRILHRNLAFPLLKKLTQVGDPQARKIFKDEIARRFSTNYLSVQTYIIEEGYLDYFTKEELETLLWSLDTDEKVKNEIIKYVSQKEMGNDPERIMEKFMVTPFPENIFIVKDGFFKHLSDRDINNLIDDLAYLPNERKALTNLSLIYIYYDLKGQAYKPHRIKSHFLKSKTIASKFWNQVGKTYDEMGYPQNATKYYKKSAEIKS